MAELVDAAVSKTDILPGYCGFESRRPHTYHTLGSAPLGLAQRASTALRALALRSSFVILAALAGPPFLPPFLPSFEKYSAIPGGSFLRPTPK